jgi:hypothetical protein
MRKLVNGNGGPQFLLRTDIVIPVVIYHSIFRPIEDHLLFQHMATSNSEDTHGVLMHRVPDYILTT